jgi:type II secretory pathway pseudopilin PulG
MLGLLLARRAYDPEAGFSLLEMVVAISVMFGALLVLLSTALVGLSDAALARQRHSANAIANRVIEQVRALPYEKLGQGLKTADLPSDPNVVTCPDGKYYFKPCGASAEEIVHTPGLPNLTPVVPNSGSVGPPIYPNTFTWRTYVTRALGVPSAGAYRVTAIVSWNATVRPGAALPVRAQTLIYKPEGSTDPTTGGGTFFYGTSDLSRGSVKLTPNPGVSGGTGVTGLPSWDSVAQDLSGLGTDVTAQALTRSDGQVTLDGARKAIGGVETETAGVASVAKADDDPATSFPTSAAPSSISGASTAVTVTGGGNTLSAGGPAPSGGGGCPGTQPNVDWMTGMEHGTNSGGGGLWSLFSPSGISVDSAVKRNGAYSFKVAAIGDSAYAYTIIGPGVATVQHMHFAIRLGSLPSSDVTSLASLTANNSASYGFYLGYQASSQKFMARIRSTDTNYGPWIPASSGAGTVSAGTWYTVDLLLDVSVSPIKGKWQINGVAGTEASISATTSTLNYRRVFGSEAVGNTFTANYDDILVSFTPADYPLADMAINRLVPNGMGTHNPASPTALQNNDSTAINASSYQRLDDVPINTVGETDYIKQVSNSGSSYVELTFQDPPETCIRAIRAFLAWAPPDSNQSNHGKTSVFDGATETVVSNGSMGGNVTTLRTRSMTVVPASAPWTNAAVSGLRARIGYSTDASPLPKWEALMLEYGVASGAGAAPPSDQSGYGKATVPPSSPGTCYAGQTAGACAYSQAAYPANPPTRQTLIDLAGSGAGECLLYKYIPDVATSFAYGHRDFTMSPTGSIVGDVSHRYGVHEIGGLCASTVAAPAGWPGYLVKYDPGGATGSVKAAAGVQATYPRFTGVGTISYWNGTGVSTMAPPAAGGTIPVANFTGYISNGWRYDIDVTLAALPSSVTQVPVGAPMSGTADRTEAKAVLGAPIAGKIAYKLTNTGSSNVVIDVTIDVDLGSLTTSSVYTPP